MSDFFKVPNVNMWQDVLDYWFGPAEQGHLNKWFRPGPEVDEEITKKFGSMVNKAIQGDLEEWEKEPGPSLALIILADQFPRGVFRHTPKAFSGDARARSIARKFLEEKTHNHMDHSFAERLFIYLTFEHSETLEDQELSVKLMDKLAEDSKGSDFEGMGSKSIEMAIRHREVIERFGRYPHRNKALGRENTPEEEEFLKNLPDRYKW